MPSPRGAYGLALSTPPVGPEWWVEAPPRWSSWNIEWSPADSSARRELAEEPDCITSPLHDGIVAYRLGRATTTIYTSAVPAPHSLIHPYFGQTAVLHAWSQGWSALHGGAFVMDGQVWAILGDRQRGKSSALAWLLAAGFDVFTDDLVVLKDRLALAGPRSLDLREGAANQFRVGIDVGIIGMRRRWRANLKPIPAELPMAGWVLLEWRPGTPQVRRAGTRESLSTLTNASALLGTPVNGTRLLDLASLPMYVFERPQDWSTVDTGMETLVHSLKTGST